MIALILSSLLAHAQWTEGNTIGVKTDNPKSPIAIFVNTTTDSTIPVGINLPGIWYRLNVTTLGIPSGVKSLFLSGILIITHGTTIETCDLTTTFRAPGDTLNSGNYEAQTIEALVGSGQRSTMSIFTPVKNDEIEFQWNRSTQGTWPNHCSYGINLSAQAYVR